MIKKGDRVLIGPNEYDGLPGTLLPKPVQGYFGTAGEDEINTVVSVHIDGVEDPPILGDEGWAFFTSEVVVVEVANR